MFHTYDIDSCDSNNNSGVRAKSTLAKNLKTIKWIYQGQKTFLGVNWAFTIPRTRILNSWIWRPNTGVSLTEEQKIYNSRQSRGCRVIENAFGVLSVIRLCKCWKCRKVCVGLIIFIQLFKTNKQYFLYSYRILGFCLVRYERELNVELVSTYQMSFY